MLQLLFVAVEMEQQSHKTNVLAGVGLQFITICKILQYARV